MVRRAVEEICLDKTATGTTLYDRIEALGGLVVLPQPFGDEEVSAGIEIAKELIRAVYQYDAISGGA
jgi:hypothetical protein